MTAPFIPTRTCFCLEVTKKYFCSISHKASLPFLSHFLFVDLLLTLIAATSLTPFHEMPLQTLETNSKVSFSPCGEFVAIDHHGRPWPQLIPLLSSPSLRCAKRLATGPDLMVASDKRRKVYDVQAVGPDLSILTDNLPNAITTGTVVVSTDSKRTNTAVTYQRIDSNGVVVAQDNSSGSHKVTITRLPPHLLGRSTAATTSLPIRSSESTASYCTTILTSSTEPTYASDEVSVAQHLPVVLRKDTRALRTETHQPLLENRESSP